MDRVVVGWALLLQRQIRIHLVTDTLHLLLNLVFLEEIQTEGTRQPSSGISVHNLLTSVYMVRRVAVDLALPEHAPTYMPPMHYRDINVAIRVRLVLNMQASAPESTGKLVGQGRLMPVVIVLRAGFHVLDCSFERHLHRVHKLRF